MTTLVGRLERDGLAERSGDPADARAVLVSITPEGLERLWSTRSCPRSPTSSRPPVAPVERPVASSAYSFLRFAGGAIAPYLAGKLAEAVSLQAPFLVGAGAVLLALVILVTGRRHLAAAETPAGAPLPEPLRLRTLQPAPERT